MYHLLDALGGELTWLRGMFQFFRMTALNISSRLLLLYYQVVHTIIQYCTVLQIVGLFKVLKGGLCNLLLLQLPFFKLLRQLYSPKGLTRLSKKALDKLFPSLTSINVHVQYLHCANTFNRSILSPCEKKKVKTLGQV